MSHTNEVKVRNQPFYLEADNENRKLISSQRNTGTAYYSTERAVSDTSYQHVLPTGKEAIIQRGMWFYSPTKARLRVRDLPAVETRRKFGTLHMWGHSYSWAAAGGGANHSHFVPKVAVNLLGANRVESRSVSGSRWTDVLMRDGTNLGTLARQTGSSWVDFARYCHQTTSNWPTQFISSPGASAYMFMHGCNDYGTLGVDAIATFVNAAEFAFHLALSRQNWYQSDRRDPTEGGSDVPVTGIDLSGPTTVYADSPYWSTVSGDAGASEAKTDRNTGTDTWAFTSDTVQRVQLPNWGGLQHNVSPSGTVYPWEEERTIGITFIIDPATDGTVTVTNDRTGTTSGEVSLSATGQTRPVNGTFPTSLPAPKVVRIDGCHPLDTLTVTITGITGKVQVDAFGIEAKAMDADAPLCIWNIQPKMLPVGGPFIFHSSPFSMTDTTYDLFTQALRTMGDRFPPQLVRMVNHDHRHVRDYMIDTVHPDPYGSNLMALNIRDVIAPGVPDYDALRPPGGDDEWHAFSDSEDDYEEITQAAVFDIVPAAGFRRRLNGTVELRGVMGRDAAPVAQDVIATLPVGFRPHSRWTHFDVRIGHAAAATFGTARIRIESGSGNIIFSGYSVGSSTDFPQLYLDGIIFEGQF